MLVGVVLVWHMYQNELSSSALAMQVVRQGGGHILLPAYLY